LVVSIAAVLPLGDPYSGAEQGGEKLTLAWCGSVVLPVSSDAQFV